MGAAGKVVILRGLLRRVAPLCRPSALHQHTCRPGKMLTRCLPPMRLCSACPGTACRANRQLEHLAAQCRDGGYPERCSRCALRRVAARSTRGCRFAASGPMHSSRCCTQGIAPRASSSRVANAATRRCRRAAQAEGIVVAGAPYLERGRWPAAASSGPTLGSTAHCAARRPGTSPTIRHG